MRSIAGLASFATIGLLIFAAAATDAQPYTPEGQELLLEAIRESYREQGCRVDVSSIALTEVFYERMSEIAAILFEDAGLVFPDEIIDQDVAFASVYGPLHDQGDTVREGGVSRYLDACLD